MRGAVADPSHRLAVVALWRRCGLTRPWNDPDEDFDATVDGGCSAVVVLTDEGLVVAAAMVGHDGHRGAAYYVGVDPERQGRGLGRALMAEVERWLMDRGVSKLNLLVRHDNIAAAGFYEALGYGDQGCSALGKRLDGRADRTPPG